MCRSKFQNVVAPNNEQAASISFDLKENNTIPPRKIVAIKGLKVIAPWMVLKSQQYEGRYFFFNTKTNESQWSIDSTFCILKNDSSSKKHEKSESETKTVNMAIKSFRTLRRSQSLSVDTDTTNESEGSESIESDSIESTISIQDELEEQEDDDEASEIISPMLKDVDLEGRKAVTAAEEQEEQVISNGSFPHFKVLSGLGMGGYATVVKVKHIESNQDFAMKVITKSKVDEKNQNILKFEYQVMTEINESPFLQRCHLAFENNYNLYFILDLNLGGDLFHHLMLRCESGEYMGMDEKVLKIILAELYLALEHLHKYNIIHRDIKIENVMLTSEGHVKLIDFGLSKQLKTSVESMSPCGSLIYMAPELINDNIGGKFTDWWAYGVMAFELITGRTPWSSMTDGLIIKQEISNVNVKKYLIHDVSPCLTHFICSLMNKDYKVRLGTFQDEDIKKQSFFKTIDWKALSQLKLPPALIPNKVNTTLEARNAAYDAYLNLRDLKVKHENNWTMGLDNAAHFLV